MFNMKTVFQWMHPKHKAGRILHNASQKRQLKGRIQANKDNSLDVKELSNYVIKEVKEQAALSGREQTPQIIGDNSKLLIQYWIVRPKKSA